MVKLKEESDTKTGSGAQGATMSIFLAFSLPFLSSTPCLVAQQSNKSMRIGKALCVRVR